MRVVDSNIIYGLPSKLSNTILYSIYTTTDCDKKWLNKLTLNYCSNFSNTQNVMTTEENGHLENSSIIQSAKEGGKDVDSYRAPVIELSETEASTIQDTVCKLFLEDLFLQVLIR